MAAALESRDAFGYDELFDCKTYFRLLRVASATIGEPTEDDWPVDRIVAECELTAWPTADAPPYRAVSYTWGDPEKTRWIRVNGRPMQVRWNCAYVLWQAHRHSGAHCYIWVDAICINQVDNWEKSFQVAQMGSIFDKAEQVLICIGPHDAYSKFLFPALIRHARFFMELSEPGYAAFWTLDPASKSQFLRWRFTSSKPWKLAASVFNVVRRPYFQRVWTYPECWMACGADILCGEDRAPAQALRGLYLLARTEARSQSAVPAWFKAVPILRRMFLWRWPATRQMALDETGANHLDATQKDRGARVDPEFALRGCEGLECADIRDRIYALTSIMDAEELGETPIQPNYEIDPFDLVVDFLRLISPGSFIAIHMLVELLRLSELPTPRTTQAISDRHHKHTIRSATWIPADKVSSVGKDKPVFHGFQVFLDNRKWKIGVPSHKHGGLDDECFVSSDGQLDIDWEALNNVSQPYHHLSGENNQTIALLPSCTKSGDWIVGDRLAGYIILREREDGRYSIIGEACADVRLDSCMREIGRCFTMFFDSADFLVLHLTKFNNKGKEVFYSRKNLEPSVMANILANAVCHTTGSSYAELQTTEAERIS